MIVRLLKIITFLVAILFIARECYVWWNLSLCDMELCDSKYIDINIKLNTKSLRICYFLNGFIKTHISERICYSHFSKSLIFTNSTNHSSFCRSVNGRIAGSFPKLLTDGDETCGNKDSLFVFQGVFLNQTARFTDGYTVFKFDIRLFDFTETSKGITVFKIGFSPGPIHKGTNDDGFEWRLTRSENGERLKLFNQFNSNAWLVINYDIHLDNVTKTIKIVNRQSKIILDTFFVTKTYSKCVNIFFQLYENSLAKISVTSRSKGVGFNPDSTYNSIYTSKNNTIAHNYMSFIKNYIPRPLIQDVEVFNCTGLCVIPLTIQYEYLTSDIDASFKLYLASFDQTDEVLLLSTVQCSSYFFFAVEYFLNTEIHGKCLSLNPHLNENITILPNSLISSQQSVLVIDNPRNEASLNLHFYGYSFPIPQVLNQKHFILRFKVYNAMKLSVRLDHIKSFSYIVYILSPFLNNGIIGFINTYLYVIFILFIIIFIYLYKYFKIEHRIYVTR